MALPYWVQADLEARLSAKTVKEILDDDNDDTADAAPLARLQVDSDSKVEGYLRGIYDLEAVRASPPNEVKRLSLDVAVAMAALRHAEYVRRDGKALMEMAESDLKSLRRGDTRLDVVGTPEPAANTGGEAFAPDPDDSTPVVRVFGENFSDF